MEEISTKPYLLRAIYEWCTDNGYTPHIAVAVDANTRVPMQFVQNGQIVLNISFDATSGLKMDNDAIRFSARFSGVSKEIVIPVTNVMAIYAQENGQGMAFEVSSDASPENTVSEAIADMTAADDDENEVEEKPVHTRPNLVAVEDSSDEKEGNATDSSPNEEKNAKKSKKPVLKLIK